MQKISVAFSQKHWKKPEELHWKICSASEQNTIDLAGGRKKIGKFINHYNNNASKTLNVWYSLLFVYACMAVWLEPIEWYFRYILLDIPNASQRNKRKTNISIGLGWVD